MTTINTPPKRTYMDRLCFDEFLGVAGIHWPIGSPMMPCGDEGDIITLAGMLNLRKISVYGAFTVPDNMEGYEFIGHGQYSGLDSIDFNGQDVDGSVFRFLNITGAQGGTSAITATDTHLVAPTNIMGTFFRCLIQQVTFRNGVTDLVNCQSWQGTAAITVGVPNPLNMHGWRGDMTIGGQTGGEINIYALGGEITILNTCTGGTINIYGSAAVTDNSAGSVVNDFTIDYALAAARGGAATIQELSTDNNDLLDLSEEADSITCDGNEQTVWSSEGNDSVLEFRGIYFDFTGCNAGAGENTTLKLYIKVDGTNYREVATEANILNLAVPSPPVIPWPRSSTSQTVPDVHSTKRDIKVTIQQAAIGGGWNTIEYSEVDAKRGS